MGNSSSAIIYDKLNGVIPRNGDNGLEESSGPFKKTKLFRDEQDRKQFILAIMTVVSDNGRINLADHEFRLLYSRKPSDRIVTTLAALKQGTIQAKFVCPEDAETEGRSFRAFKRHIELRLHEMLEEIPNVNDAAFTSTVSGSDTPNGATPSLMSSALSIASSSNETSTTLMANNDAPPSYEAGDPSRRTPMGRKS